MPESGSIQRSGLSPERLRRLHRALQGYVQRGEIAGIVALIHRHGQEAHVETLGWQDKEAQIPIQRKTLFRIMSMTKPITAVAALMLVEEGKIRLYDPVDTWLPELANRMVLRDPHGSPDEVYPASRSITLHDLLTYRFGIGWTQSSMTPRIFALLPAQIADAMKIRGAEHLTPDAWMARLGEIPLLYEPGERWLYHVAADILGVLIARVAEQPLETFLQERIFVPLGMMDTSFVVPPEKRDRLAVAYEKAATGELTVWDHPQNTRWADLPPFPSGGPASFLPLTITSVSGGCCSAGENWMGCVSSRARRWRQ
jgi:CubicO group peptidase (beta-lactamase class C family)